MARFLRIRRGTRQTRAQNLRDPVWFSLQLPICQTHDVVTETTQREIPGAVILEGCAAAVVVVAIRFHNEHPLTPEEIDEVGTDADVDLRGRQTVTPAESQEVPLEITARAIPIGLLVNWESEHIRLANRSPKFPRTQDPLLALRRSDATKVRNRSRRRRNRDAATKRHNGR